MEGCHTKTELLLLLTVLMLMLARVVEGDRQLEAAGERLGRFLLQPLGRSVGLCDHPSHGRGFLAFLGFSGFTTAKTGVKPVLVMDNDNDTGTKVHAFTYRYC